MKINFFLLSLLALLASIRVNAYTAKIDGVYYWLYNNKSCVTYQSSLNTLYGDNIPDDYSTYSNYWDDAGESTSYEYCYYSDYTGEITIPQSVSYNGTIYQVSEIGSNAFNNCSATSITIPETITNIGKDVFR